MEASQTEEKHRYVVVRRVELSERLAADMNAWPDTEVVPEEEYDRRGKG